MENTAESMYRDYTETPINAIQAAQGDFVKDKRSASADVSPENRKHSCAQGFLLNNRVREDVDLDGDPINRVVGKIYDMKAVREAQKRAFEAERGDADKRKYIGGGDKELLATEEATQEVIFGEHDPRIVTIPVAGMAVGFRETMEIIHAKHPEINQVIKGSNGYGGYNGVLKGIFDELHTYRHSTDKHEFDFDSFEKALRGLDDPNKVMLLLQADAYNYIGVNPTTEQKKKMVELLQELGIFTLVDSAYQGLVDDPDKDVELARMLRETDLPFVVYDSYSKKAQLYGKRIGFLHFATGNPDQAKILRGNLYAQLRTNYLTGTDAFRTVFHLLTDPELRKVWLEEDVPAAKDILVSTKAKMAQLLGEQFGFVHPDITQGMFNGLPILHEGIEWMKKEGLYVVKAKNEDIGNEAARVNMASIAEDSTEHIAGILKEAHERFAA
jgi:aspartate/tyrosine/aromatic aminotransferase